MVVAVALIVLLLALLLTIGIITGAGESLSVDLLGSTVTTSGTGLFFSGLVTGIATLASLWLLRVGLRKGWRQRKHIRDLERRAERGDEPAGDRVPADPDRTAADDSGADRRDEDRQEPARAESGTPASDRDNP